MVNSATGKKERRGNIFRLKVGHFIQNLMMRKVIRKKVQNVGYANTHAAGRHSLNRFVRLLWCTFDSLFWIPNTEHT